MRSKLEPITRNALPDASAQKRGWPWTDSSAYQVQLSRDDMIRPRISIVTPSLNQARFVEETMRSVLLQGYPRLEYLVIDGGSDDGSIEIIARYERWLAYWVSEVDHGQSHAINKGFGRSSGDILGWLNSDDVYCPGALDAVISAFESDPETGMVYGNAEKIDEQGRSLGRLEHVGDYSRDIMLNEYNIIVQPAAFFRRSVFESVGGLDESLNNVMDYDLWFRIADRYTVRYIDKTLAKARVYPETKTNSSGRQRFEEIKTVARRYGGKRLPKSWRGELEWRHLSLAVEHYNRNDSISALNEILFVWRNVPEARRKGWVLRLFVKCVLRSRYRIP